MWLVTVEGKLVARVRDLQALAAVHRLFGEPPVFSSQFGLGWAPSAAPNRGAEP
jgi:hypothetical protein